MSITYTPTTNFGSKDSLPSNDPNKVIKGAEFTTEFTAIQSAFGLAAPSSNPTFTGTATFDSVTANAVSLGSVTTSDLTVNGAFTSKGIDDNATSTAITIDANENVGIGETAPSEFLHISGAAPAMRLDNSSGTTDWLMQNVSDSMRWVSVPSGGGSSTERVRFDDSGNVGIGVSSGFLGTGSLALERDKAIRWQDATNGTTYADIYGALDSSLVFRTGAGFNEGMRIDSSGNVGIGTDDPESILHVNKPSASCSSIFSSGSGGVFLSMQGANGTHQIQYGANASSPTFAFYDAAASATRMTIDDSGNVGIGTSSSGGGNSYLSSNNTMLKVKGNGANKIGSLQLQSFGTSNNSIFEVAALDASQGVVMGTMTNGSLKFQTNNATRMTLEASGDLTLATDGQNTTTSKALKWSGGGFDRADITVTNVSTFAADMHFSTGNNANYNKRMTIDSLGKVGIGTETPNRTLTVSSASGVPAELISSSTNSLLAFFDANTGVRPSLGSDGSDLVFNASGERMRIDASGNVVIGGNGNAYSSGSTTFTPAGDIANSSLSGVASSINIGGIGGVSNGFSITTNTANQHEYTFLNGSTPAMKLDTAGSLLVGTTSTYGGVYPIQAKRTGSDCFIRTTSTGDVSGRQTGYALTHEDSGITGSLGVYARGGGIASTYLNLSSNAGTGSAQQYVSQNSGTLYISSAVSHIGTSGGTVVGTQTSDERLKDIEPSFEYGLDTVMALKPIAYTRNDQDAPMRQLGFGAQTTKGIVPEAVYDTGECLDGYDVDSDDLMVQTAKSDDTKLAMEYVQIMPVLVKAMQEQQAMIEALKAEVEALKNA
jgi:hypothetical protein